VVYSSGLYGGLHGGLHSSLGEESAYI